MPITAQDLIQLQDQQVPPAPTEQLETDFELFDYPKAIIRLKQRIADWQSETSKTEARRKERYVDVDVEDLRKKGAIAEDETFVPDRVINTNIMREQPEFVAFLKQSRRLAIFNCISNPTLDPSKREQLESEFTAGLTYLGWINEFFCELDGAQTHGWSSIEVIHDDTKPLHVGFEYIRHEDFLFDQKAVDPQNDEFVLRRYNITATKLEEWAESQGFDIAQVNKILAAHKDNNRYRPFAVYKKYCKYTGIVYVSWFCEQFGTSDWLKKPEPLLLGFTDPTSAKPIPLDIYPIFVLPYVRTEEEELFQVKGRVFLDSPKQEASTAITTSFVNGMLRAADVYAAPSEPDDSGVMAELDTLEHGKIYPRPLTFFHQDYPDPTVLRALQFLDVMNTQEAGQTDFAANNREDSRKTAREITAAQQEAGLLKSVKLAVYSEHLRHIFTFSWRIVQSEAIQNRIKFLITAVQAPVVVGTAPSQTTAPIYQNDTATIQQDYDIRPAGDNDVLLRSEILQNMQQDWPVMQTTPIAMLFLSDFVRLRYPGETGRRYADAILQGDVKKQLIQALSAMLQQIVTPEEIAALAPQQKQQLQQLQQQVQQVMQQP